MKFILVLAVLIGACSAKALDKRAAGDQNPKVFSALDKLRGGANRQLSVDQIQELWLSVKPGQDFPLIAEIPKGNVDCAQFKQPGFYADVDAGQCQVFHRCDVNGNLTSYLCPNMTLFNQITLICDWWFNIDCSQAKQFYDYSNSRLYQENLVLLDDEPEYVMQAKGAVQTSGEAAPAEAKPKKNKGKAKAKAAAAE
ncbi:uncharacterized protein LOC129589728 [Paramacrobiotus metropolitanus]|uniref:uncharacterized protein LOC129589728 n=1 Tax=Paramacrobiotus metropolitanus TaxID=2943436 RepID=UPI002445C29B|nr:uncharacterized protein LOC129589728 [Paramacrobiotus metropolitanus]